MTAALENLLFRGLLFYLRWAPLWFQTCANQALAVCVYRTLGSVRRTVERNLLTAFPDSDTFWRQKTALRSFRWHMESLAEIESLRRINPKPLAFGRLEACVELSQALAEKKGAVFAGCHFGNFFRPIEALARLSQTTGKTFHLVFRALDNPRLQAQVDAFFSKLGIRTLSRFQAARRGPDLLRKGDWIYLLADNNAAIGGVFAPFFGVEASTMRGASELPIQSGCPLFFICDTADDRGTVKTSQIRVDDGDDREILSRFNTLLECEIRKEPGAYFWMQPRWKKRPPGEPPFYQDTRI